VVPGDRVLVVEDEPLIHVLLETVLEQAGFSAVIVASGEEAVTVLEAAGDMRALITDIRLGRGRMSGWALARRARAAQPALPVLYMSGDAGVDWPVEGVPGSVLLSKPFAPTELAEAVRRLVAAG
jgi:CheY-like chemotaxis protein